MSFLPAVADKFKLHAMLDRVENMLHGVAEPLATVTSTGAAQFHNRMSTQYFAQSMRRGLTAGTDKQFRFNQSGLTPRLQITGVIHWNRQMKTAGRRPDRREPLRCQPSQR